MEKQDIEYDARTKYKKYRYFQHPSETAAVRVPAKHKLWLVELFRKIAHFADENGKAQTEKRVVL